MKAVLVIDIPDETYEAYTDLYVDYDLRGTPKDDTGFVYSFVESIKYVEEASLKPLPEPEELKSGYMYSNLVALGWNGCLGEILKDDK